jgi:hypothetical protein
LYWLISQFAAAYLKTYKAHLLQASLERKSFYHHNAKAKLHWKYLSLIIDGMTQHATRLPHFASKAKFWEKQIHDVLPYYETHLVGILAFEYTGTKAHCEFSHANLSNNGCLAIDSIHNAVKRSQDGRIAAGLPLPTVLYLQLDNVSSNKGQLLMWYASWLVLTGVFEKVRISFLLVGHTHEIIDQMFSRISIKMKKGVACTLEELEFLVKWAYRPMPGTSHVTHCNDWNKFFTEAEQNYTREVNDVSFSHMFKVEKNDDGKVCLSSKRYSTEAEWSRPCEVLTGARAGEPAALPLQSLNEKQMHALRNVRQVFQKHCKPEWDSNAKLSEYWNGAITYQEDIAVRDIQHPPPRDLYSKLAKPADRGVVQERPMDAADIQQFQPELRPVYGGPRRTLAQREAFAYLQDSYLKVSFEQLHVNNGALVRASSHPHIDITDSPFVFKLKVNNVTASEPLLYVTIAEIRREDRTVEYLYYTPVKFTNRGQRTMTKQKAIDNGGFASHPQAESSANRIRFNTTDFIVAWDWDDLDDESAMPENVVDDALMVLRAESLMAASGC